MHKLNEQAELLRKGLITRRQFLSSAIALGATLPVAASLASKAVRAAELHHGVGVALCGRFSVPQQCLHGIPFHAESVVIQAAERELTPGRPRQGAFAPPVVCRSVVTVAIRGKTAVEFRR